MLRELLAIWRSSDPLRDMYGTLISMTEKGQWMFETVWQETVAGRIRPDVRDQVQRVDIEVNQAERSLRRRLVEHIIVVQPRGDVPACLVLMSVVKDAERVGDYCKEILEAAAMQREPLSSCACFERFQRTYEDIHALFVKTRRALTDSDRALAEEVMLAERNIRRTCDDLLDCLMADEAACPVGIPRALVARYLGRLAAHLSNMASSLVMPVHKIDYHDEEYLGGRDQNAGD